MPSDTQLLSKPGLLVAGLFIAFVYLVQNQQRRPENNKDGPWGYFPLPFYIFFGGTLVGACVLVHRRSQEQLLPT